MGCAGFSSAWRFYSGPLIDLGLRELCRPQYGFRKTGNNSHYWKQDNVALAEIVPVSWLASVWSA